MILFTLLSALMLLSAVWLVARPLWRGAGSEPRARNLSVIVLTAITMSVLVAGTYMARTNWSWQANDVAAAKADDTNAMLKSLRDKTQATPNDVNAWLELARAYTGAGEFAQASAAFDRANELSKGTNIDVLTGLIEALVLSDPTSLNGRVGLLLEQALRLQPNHPKALWYGGMVALQLGNLSQARDRFNALLALNPPPQVRSLLERQIQDLTEQLGDGVAAGSGASSRKVIVNVSIAPALKAKLSQPLSLFVLARNSQQPGPPFAVERHQASELPLRVELTTADAMLPTRTIADVQDVEIVARLSASGMPTEQAGDYFGTARYSFAKQGEQGSVAIEINQVVK